MGKCMHAKKMDGLIFVKHGLCLKRIISTYVNTAKYIYLGNETIHVVELWKIVICWCSR